MSFIINGISRDNVVMEIVAYRCEQGLDSYRRLIHHERDEPAADRRVCHCSNLKFSHYCRFETRFSSTCLYIWEETFE